MSSNEERAEQYTANAETCRASAKQLEGPNKFLATPAAKKIAKTYRTAASFWQYAAQSAVAGQPWSEDKEQQEVESATRLQATADERRSEYEATL